MRKLECPECGSKILFKREYVDTLKTYELEVTEEGNEPGELIREELMGHVNEEFGECQNCYTQFTANDAGGIDLNNIIERGA